MGRRKDVTNPKDGIGSRKVPYSAIPTTVIAAIALGMGEGALKYGAHNYRAAAVRGSIYAEAAIGHIFSWIEGEDIDPDTGDARIHHIAKAMASLAVLYDAIVNEMLVDDRPIRAKPGTFGRCAALNAQWAALLAKYPNPVPRYTQAGLKSKRKAN